MIVKLTDGSLWRHSVRFTPRGFRDSAAPFLQAAQGRGVRKMRIQRKKHNFVQWAGGPQYLQGFFRKWMPVAHGRDDGGINVWSQSLKQFSALALRENADR